MGAGQHGATPWYHYESAVIRQLGIKASLFYNSNLRLGVFAQNLLNDQGFVNPFGFGANGVRSRPRTLGIEFGLTVD